MQVRRKVNHKIKISKITVIESIRMSLFNKSEITVLTCFKVS